MRENLLLRRQNTAAPKYLVCVVAIVARSRDLEQGISIPLIYNVHFTPSVTHHCERTQYQPKAISWNYFAGSVYGRALETNNYSLLLGRRLGVEQKLPSCREFKGKARGSRSQEEVTQSIETLPPPAKASQGCA
jgi:hypothetical protein